MKLIQLSTLDLEQKIEAELGENPALETGAEEEIEPLDNTEEYDDTTKIDTEENPPKSIGEIFSAPGTDFDDLKEALEINKEDESEISDEFSDKEE